MERCKKGTINQQGISPAIKSGIILRGKVRHYNQRGSKLGFPTANLNLHRSLPSGVYLSKVKINNRRYPALAFIGAPLTFNDPIKRMEVYIDDFGANLYNRWISVTLIEYLRANRRFRSPRSLINQINRDLNVLRNNSIFTANPTNK